MDDTDMTLSERVVETVSSALDTDPLDLPPIEKSISSEALDYLFHPGHQPEGAYTIFPYCDLWVVVHSKGCVDVFEEYRATAQEGQLPSTVDELSTDERVIVLHFGDEKYLFFEDHLDEFHKIVGAAEDSDEAWERAIEFARQHPSE